MNNQNLFEALERICNFIALESDMDEIKNAIKQDEINSFIQKISEHDGMKISCSCGKEIISSDKNPVCFEPDCTFK